MLSSLVFKEWRELALVRWLGLALGAVLFAVSAVGESMARRPAPRDLMFELLPASLALGLWPFIALLATAQTFAVDRAGGACSETRAWGARVLASSGTLFSVMAGTGAMAAAGAALAYAPSGFSWSRWDIIVTSGVAAGLLAYAGGLIAATLLSSPLAAVMLGVVLAALPAALAGLLSSFIFARFRSVHLGAILPVLLLPPYVGASWLAACRGGPARRGRIRRAVAVLGSALAAVCLIFAALAPLVVRANAAAGQHTIWRPSAGGSVFVASTDEQAGGGWLVDRASGSKLAFVAPPIREIAWSPDGSEVACLTWSGPLGSVSARPRLDIRSASHGRVLRSFSVADGEQAHSLLWSEAGIALIVVKERDVDVEVVDPRTGEFRPTGFRTARGFQTRLVAPTQDKQVFVQVVLERKGADGRGVPYGYRLHPLDVAAARVGPAISDAAARTVTFAGYAGGLSPSGRFARVLDAECGADHATVVDLGGGPIDQAPPPWPLASWLSDDRLAWLASQGERTRLLVMRPGSEPRAVREWTDSQVGLQFSPDRSVLFISVLPAAPAPEMSAAHPLTPPSSSFDGIAPQGTSPEELIYFAADDRIVSLGAPFSDRSNDQRHSEWAGPRTLARVAPGVVCLDDIETARGRRFVIGGPKDLE